MVVRGVTVAVAGAGWWLIFPSQTRPQLRTCVLLRFIREATNVLLPMAQVGGDVIGAGLLTRYAVPGALAAASVIVDVLLQAATQFLFAIVGLLVLIALEADATLARVAAIGLGLGASCSPASIWRNVAAGSAFSMPPSAASPATRKWRVLGTIDSVYQNLAMIYAARSDLVASTVVHMAGWIVGVAEVLIVFAFMGNPISLAEALVIESLLHAIRGAAFAIPGALGRAGRRPGAAVRRIRNSAGAGDCAVAGQAGGRSRARRAGPCRLADAGVGTPDAELFPGRAATADSRSILVRSEP